MTTDEAIVEVGWVAREALELTATCPTTEAPVSVQAEWLRRWDAYVARKQALLDHIEGAA